jgi:hypothetical protein
MIPRGGYAIVDNRTLLSLDTDSLSPLWGIERPVIRHIIFSSELASHPSTRFKRLELGINWGGGGLFGVQYGMKSQFLRPVITVSQQRA